MNYYKIESLYDKQKTLWKEKAKIELRLRDIRHSREDLEIEKSIIESDLMQEVGFTKEEFDEKYKAIFKEEAKLDDKEHDLGYRLHQVERKLSEIFLDLSQKLSQQAA